MRRYEWIIFDFGGTLDSEIDNPTGDRGDMRMIYGDILSDWFASRERRVEAAPEELQKLTELAHEATPGSPGQISLLDNIEYYSKWMSFIYRELGFKEYVPLTELEASRLFTLEEYMRRHTAKPADSTFDALDALRKSGTKMGVLSNNNGYVEDMVANAGIREFFVFVEDSARIGAVKPDRRIFDFVAERYSLNPCSTLYVGDDFINDVRGALDAGWNAAWLTRSGEESPCLKREYHRIARLSELTTIQNGEK